MRRRDLVDLALVLGVWAVAIVFIRPYGEFPILDDWDFTIATWNFARTGRFHFTPFTAVSLRAMVLWGAGWTHLFGKSFFVLRLSTLTLAGVTVAIVHEILQRAGLDRLPRIVATLAFAFQPIFLWSSCTFMTEVPFVCASAVAFLLIWRGLEQEKASLVIAGCAAALVSCFVRQTGIINIVAPLVVVLFLPSKRRFVPILLAAAAIFAAIFFGRPEWLAGSPKEFASHYKVWHETSFRAPQQIALAYHYFVFNAQNCGLFLLPLVAPLVLVVRRRVAIFIIATVVILWRVQHLLNTGIAMPYFAFASQEDILQGNVFIDFGLGPPTLIDVWSLKNPYPFHLLPIGKLLITYASVIAGAILISNIRLKNLLSMLAVALAATGTVALLGSGFYSDRYSLDSAWSIGIALALWIPWKKQSAQIIAITALIIVSIFSVMSVQEYFAWNRARWAAYDSLRARGVPVTAIDGGSEPTNWYEISKMNRDEARKRTMFRPARPYVITFGILPEHLVIAQFPFDGWLGLHRGAVYILKNVQPTVR